ncbi:MAG: ribosome small subunit-dependent GTPase A [Pirellulaceae bacterium]|nr:ribosome small subunit-dependent GTPase A [Pirellulaceae bacterium]
MSKKNKNQKKIRAEFKKNYDTRRRKNDLTRDFDANQSNLEDLNTAERVSGKGRWTRKRTVTGDISGSEDTGFNVALEIDESQALAGRVIRVHGLSSIVETSIGTFECTTRGLLKSLATDLQNVVVAGDHVTIQQVSPGQGVVVRVEQRRNFIDRTSRGRQQIIASNIDLALIVSSAAEPTLKPNLIDRFLIAIDKAQLQPVIVINKIDLVDVAELQPLVGVWAQLGYPVVLVSTVTGQGVDRLRHLLAGKDSVVAGQSGVGKSSLLNSLEPGLTRRVATVSEENSKGRHTTTTAELVRLSFGGHLIDTPGIRQFQLWDVVPEEVEGYFRDLRPFVHQCRYPNCTHTHEEDCAVKDAVADGWIDVRRYDGYCQIRSGD